MTLANGHQRLDEAFPGYGGTTIQPLQNYFLYPGNR